VSLPLNSQAYLRAPHGFLAAARDERMFVRQKLPFLGKCTLVLGHPECMEFLKSSDRFAVDARNAGFDSPFGLKFLPESLKVLSNNLLSLDDPDHLRLRRLVDQPFRRVSIDDLRPRIRHACDRLVAEMVGAGETDLVEGLCRQLPLLVIYDLLGFSPETRERLDGVLQGLTATGNVFNVMRAVMKLGSVRKALSAEFERARAEPGPGLVADLVHAEADGDSMSNDELFAMVFVLFVAGHETTKHLISTSVYTLLTEPGAADQYRAMDEDARGVAVDELMRYCAPVQMTKPRHVREDLEFHGLALKRGERLVAMLAAANIDERVFDTPQELDLTRRPNRHLGWGGGPHICLGLHLARAEAQAALDSLLDAWPNLALGGDPGGFKWIPRSGLRGLKQLPVIFG
jgi:cytochrome P450